MLAADDLVLRKPGMVQTADDTVRNRAPQQYQLELCSDQNFRRCRSRHRDAVNRRIPTL